MTHCLFHNGVQAVAADMQIRFVEQVSCDAELDIRAWVLSSTPPLYRLRAELVHNGWSWRGPKRSSCSAECWRVGRAKKAEEMIGNRAIRSDLEGAESLPAGQR